MRDCRFGTFALLVSFASPIPGALPMGPPASETATSRTADTGKPRQVPPTPADIKGRGDRLWNAASPAVRSWAKQNAAAIAGKRGKLWALARAAVHARWPHLRVAGASQALAFLLTYEALQGMQANLGDASDQWSMIAQMALARMSQAYETLSNMMKTLAATSEAIVGNIKN